MDHPKMTLNETALRAHDDAALEAVRFELARDGRPPPPSVVAVLAERASTTIVATCRELGAHRGVGPKGIGLAIRDAQARIQMRLRQPERLPLIELLAGGIARACIEAQPIAPPKPPKLDVPARRSCDSSRDCATEPSAPTTRRCHEPRR